MITKFRKPLSNEIEMCSKILEQNEPNSNMIYLYFLILFIPGLVVCGMQHIDLKPIILFMGIVFLIIAYIIFKTKINFKSIKKGRIKVASATCVQIKEKRYAKGYYTPVHNYFFTTEFNQTGKIGNIIGDIRINDRFLIIKVNFTTYACKID